MSAPLRLPRPDAARLGAYAGLIAGEARATRLAAMRLAARVAELKCREEAFEASLALASLSRRKVR